MNLLVELVGRRITKRDSAAAYAVSIRDHLLANGGRPIHRAHIPDPDPVHSLHA